MDRYKFKYKLPETGKQKHVLILAAPSLKVAMHYLPRSATHLSYTQTPTARR